MAKKGKKSAKPMWRNRTEAQKGSSMSSRNISTAKKKKR